MEINIEKLAGKKVSEWTLIEKIGKGADGIVYRASNDEGKYAAIKIFIHESLEKNGINEARVRLDLQRTLIGKKHHPNLVEIFEGGEVKELNTLYLAMELIPGKSLDKLLGEIPIDKVPALILQLAEVARFLEEKFGLYHRDIKPANIIVNTDLTNLTLLDLGIVYRISQDCDDRISGDEFVATLRYSPHEFVWREEENKEEEAWRAITIYQIGATLYDMIAGRIIFDEAGNNRAHLYDCVKYKTPQFPSINGSYAWLVSLAQSCLLKDWRQRLNLVTWERFSGLNEENTIHFREHQIMLKQAHIQEQRIAEAQYQKEDGRNEQILWNLNSEFIGELRKYLRGSPIFPQCEIEESIDNEKNFLTKINFEMDERKGFCEKLSIQIRLFQSTIYDGAIDLSISIFYNCKCIENAKWIEHFNVEGAVNNCRQAILAAVYKLINGNQGD